MSAPPEPAIIITKESGFFRVLVRPPGHLQSPGLHRPSTYASHLSASNEAALLFELTGLPVIDQTGERT